MAFVRSTIPSITAKQPIALSQRIIELATPALIMKGILEDVNVGPGRTFVWTKASGSRAVGISEISEGAATPYDYTDYYQITYEPPLYRQGFKLSRETIEDVNPVLDILSHQTRRMARRVAYTVENAVETALTAAVSGVTSNAATGTTLGSDGNYIYFSGTGTVGLGGSDILKAKRAIEDYNIIPDTMLLAPSHEEYLLKIPGYTYYERYGEEVLQTGRIGRLYGLDIRVSTIIPNTRCYVVATGGNNNVSAAYEPLGFWIWKRNVEAAVGYDWDDDIYKTRVSFRGGPLIVTPQAAAQIAGITAGLG